MYDLWNQSDEHSSFQNQMYLLGELDIWIFKVWI